LTFLIMGNLTARSLVQFNSSNLNEGPV
jgi:hypothetical protein